MLQALIRLGNEWSKFKCGAESFFKLPFVARRDLQAPGRVRVGIQFAMRICPLAPSPMPNLAASGAALSKRFPKLSRAWEGRSFCSSPHKRRLVSRLQRLNRFSLKREITPECLLYLPNISFF